MLLKTLHTPAFFTVLCVCSDDENPDSVFYEAYTGTTCTSPSPSIKFRYIALSANKGLKTTSSTTLSSTSYIKSIHAEVGAMYNMGRHRLRGADIYVARLPSAHSDKLSCLSRPCENCMNAMRKAGIRSVYYTKDTPLESPQILWDVYTF